MIRDFENGDQFKFTLNKFSGLFELEDVFEESGYEKVTVLNKGGDIIGILCWYLFAPDCYATFLLMSDKGVGIAEVREIKEFFRQKAEEVKAKLIVTYSLDCDTINKWHEFIGFKKENNEGILIKGRKFNKWVIKWG